LERISGGAQRKEQKKDKKGGIEELPTGTILPGPRKNTHHQWNPKGESEFKDLIKTRQEVRRGGLFQSQTTS